MLTVEKSRSDDMDDLDAYMMSIKSGGMNATGRLTVWRSAHRPTLGHEPLCPNRDVAIKMSIYFL